MNLQALKNSTISTAILARINAGDTPQQAFDAVLGEGSYAKMAGELYDSLRTNATATTKHTHPVIFGRKVSGCPRCTELNLGMPARQWDSSRKQADAMRLRDIRSHVCSHTCGVVCTFGDW